MCVHCSKKSSFLEYPMFQRRTNLIPFMQNRLFYLKSLDNTSGVCFFFFFFFCLFVFLFFVVFFFLFFFFLFFFITTMFYINSYIQFKQCRPWCDAAFCGVWSRSTMFANAPSQRAHDVNIMSPQRRCNVMTLHRRWGDVIFTSCARWVLWDSRHKLV